MKNIEKNIFSVLLLSVLLLLSLLGKAQSNSLGVTHIHEGGEAAVYGTHHFTTGVIVTARTGSKGYVSFTEASTHTGASDNAYVDGYVKSYKTGDFIFPIGDAIYAPIKVSKSSVAQPIEAAFYKADPTSAGYNVASIDETSVSAVNNYGYWNITGATSTYITLSWRSENAIQYFQNLIIVAWNTTTSKWEEVPSQYDVTDLIRSGNSTNASGTITTTQEIVPNNYKIFALGVKAPPVLDLNPDEAYVLKGNTLTVNVLTNDTLDGLPLEVGSNQGQVTISETGSAWPAGITLNTSTGDVTLANTLNEGFYQVYYRVCVNGANPAVCDEAILEIIVDKDSDSDGIGDTKDLDDDNDGICDVDENAPNFVPTPMNILLVRPNSGAENIPQNMSAEFSVENLPGSTITERQINVTSNAALTPGYFDGFDMVVIGGWVYNEVHIDWWNALENAITNKTSNAFVIYNDRATTAGETNSTNGVNMLNNVFGTSYTNGNLITSNFSAPKNNASLYADVTSLNQISVQYYGFINNVYNKDAIYFDNNNNPVAIMKRLPGGNCNQFVYYMADTSPFSAGSNQYSNNANKIAKSLALAYQRCNNANKPDLDGDGIPNYLDLDSDADGCADAIEGDENAMQTNLVASSMAGGSTGVTDNLGNNVGTNLNNMGVPTIVNSGGVADIGNDVGQGIGVSQTKATILMQESLAVNSPCVGNPLKFNFKADTNGDGWEYQLQKSGDGGAWNTVHTGNVLDNVVTPIDLTTSATTNHAGTYRVVITNENNPCVEIIQQVDATVYELPTFKITVKTALCVDDNDIIKVEILTGTADKALLYGENAFIEEKQIVSGVAEFQVQNPGVHKYTVKVKNTNGTPICETDCLEEVVYE